MMNLHFKIQKLTKLNCNMAHIIWAIYYGPGNMGHCVLKRGDKGFFPTNS